MGEGACSVGRTGCNGRGSVTQAVRAASGGHGPMGEGAWHIQCVQRREDRVIWKKGRNTCSVCSVGKTGCNGRGNDMITWNSLPYMYY